MKKVRKRKEQRKREEEQKNKKGVEGANTEKLECERSNQLQLGNSKRRAAEVKEETENCERLSDNKKSEVSNFCEFCCRKYSFKCVKFFVFCQYC